MRFFTSRRVAEAAADPTPEEDRASPLLAPAAHSVPVHPHRLPHIDPGPAVMSTKTVPVLTLDGARIALSAAEARSKEIKIPMNIAIVDNACHLLAFARMEGAKFTSINIAIDKAYTAAGHRAPTSVYKENVWPGGPAFGINHSNSGRFMTIAGGIPIVKDGVVVGAVGCSTGTPSQDEDVAKKGVEAAEKSFGLKAKL